MIAKPEIGKLLDKVNSRYVLVIAVSRRARQLASGDISLTNFKSESQVSVAAHEVSEGKVTVIKGV